MRMTLMRKQRRWSQARLARESELCQSTLSSIESGRFHPYPSQLLKLANALDWKGDPEDLLRATSTTKESVSRSSDEQETS
jgi:transcriptional regulator with XRE-family HTH domain